MENIILSFSWLFVYIKMKYIVISFLWVLYFILHSTMITLKFKGAVRKRIGNYFKFYRLFYNIIATVLFIPLIIYSASIAESNILIWDGNLKIIKWIIKGIGVYLVIAGFSHWNMSNILGIQQIKMDITGLFMNASTKLDSSGILGKIRHPVYAGTILLIWTDDMDITRIIITSLVTLYFFFGAIIEERKRLIEFNGEYSLYREKVSMLFPAKYIVNQLLSLRNKIFETCRNGGQL